jgi:hypothetical protein
VTRTATLYGVFARRLLDYQPAGEMPLNAVLGGRLYAFEPPEPAQFPFAVMRLFGRRTGGGDDGALREDGSLEIQFFGRPRGQSATVDLAADIAEEALLRWYAPEEGALMMRRLVSRETLPPFPSEANREIVRVRGVWTYTWWPQYRTQTAVPAGAPAPTP